MSVRVDKVAHAIQKEVQMILHDELRDPRLGLVTITKVELAPDLRHARVLFSVLGSAEEFAKTREALESASGFIRKLVTERINLKFSPELIFREDHSVEHSVHIEKILNEIKTENKGEEDES